MIDALCILVLIACVQGAPVTRNGHEVDNRKIFDMVKNLQPYGYLDLKKAAEDDGSIFDSGESKRNGFCKYHEYSGLPKGRETRDLMRNDVPVPNRSQEYTRLGTKWLKNDITWKVVKWTQKLTQTEQRQALENAFQYWADVTPLTFTYTEDTPDIEIMFASGEHGDGNAFDGKGGLCAHAFKPGNISLSGDTHFDDDEDWTYHESRGTGLQIVAARKFGHALGLSHSRVPGSAMAPFYADYDPQFKLSADDIQAIQKLYGPRPNTTETTTITVSGPNTTTDLPDDVTTLYPKMALSVGLSVGPMATLLVVVIVAFAWYQKSHRRQKSESSPVEDLVEDAGPTSIPLAPVSSSDAHVMRTLSDSSTTTSLYPELTNREAWTHHVFQALSLKLSDNWQHFMRNLPGNDDWR